MLPKYATILEATLSAVSESKPYVQLDVRKISAPTIIGQRIAPAFIKVRATPVEVPTLLVTADSDTAAI